MKTIEQRIKAVLLAAICLLSAVNTQARTTTFSDSGYPYIVSDTDLLQLNVSSVETTNVTMYTGDYFGGYVSYLTDGTTGPGSKTLCYSQNGGSVIYTLDTSTSPNGYTITGVDSYTGWQDGGRVDQRYIVSFRQVGSGTFDNVITNNYSSGNKETRLQIRNINLVNVEAIKFTFTNPQENNGVGYKEFDVFGIASTTNFTYTGVSSDTAFPVSDTDVLQDAEYTISDPFTYRTESGYTNALVPALTDGEFGSADKYIGTCGIVEGTVTYTLDITDHPAGYTIPSLDTFTGWNDSGRDDQNYRVSFRKVGSSSFGDEMPIHYIGTVKLTHVNVTNTTITGVDAVKFIFADQENSGVGYKELDVNGIAPAYTDITRRDSGSQVIASNDTANVLLTEGTGTPGTITLNSPITIIDTLTQDATDEIATIDPAGQTLALNGLFSKADAGGLLIETGTVMGTQRLLNIGNWSTNTITVNADITNSVGNGVLLKSGSGTLTFSGTSSCPGGTEVTSGTLRLTDNSSLGNGPLTVTGATLQLDGGDLSPATGDTMNMLFVDAELNQTDGDLYYGGYLQARNTTLDLSGGTSEIRQDILLGWGGTNTAATIRGSHTADWRTTQFTAGDVSLTLQSGGTLYTDKIFSYAGANATILFDGGVLAVSSIDPDYYDDDWISVLSGTSGSVDLYVQDGGAIIDTYYGSVTIKRPFLQYGSSTGGLTKINRYTLTLDLSSPCTYAGHTTVQGGTLKLAPGTAPLPSDTRLSLAVDTILDLNGAEQAVGELVGAGRVINSSSTSAILTVGGLNTTTNFDGWIEGDVHLVKTGTGTFTLTGANSYTNGTEIQGGTLRLAPLPLSIVNAGFELPDLNPGSYGYMTSDGVSGGWKMSGHPGTNIGSGISYNNSPESTPWVHTAPEGHQVCFIQTAAFCMQTVTVSQAGTYQLSFSAANRPGHNADNIEILLDGNSKAAWTYTDFNNEGVFQSFTTNISLSAGTHELRFVGSTPGGDTTTLIDDIRLESAGDSPWGTLPADTALTLSADGTLDLNGTWQTLSGISGSGVVTNGTLSVDGIIAPGGTNEIGTLTLAASLDLSGTLLIDVETDGSSDMLQVQGNLDLSGLSLQIEDLDKISSNETYLIATCSPGGLSGRFTSTNLGTKRVVAYNNTTGSVSLVSAGTVILVY